MKIGGYALKTKNIFRYRKAPTHEEDGCAVCDHFVADFHKTGSRCRIMGLKDDRAHAVRKGMYCDNFMLSRKTKKRRTAWGY